MNPRLFKWKSILDLRTIALLIWKLDSMRYSIPLYLSMATLATPHHPLGSHLISVLSPFLAWLKPITYHFRQSVSFLSTLTSSLFPHVVTSLPTVSILIPCFNPDCDHLRQALDSCVLQSYPHNLYEVLICLDGPADPSVLALVANYSSTYSNITSLQSDQHIGLTNILNLGLLHSKSKYIARLDADDMMLPERLSVQVNYLESHREITILGSSLFLFDQRSKPLGLKRYPTHPVHIQALGCFCNPVAHPSVMFHRSTIINNGSYRLSSPYEDYHLWSCLPSSLANISQPLTIYRKHDSQISSQKKLSYITILAIRISFFKSLLYSPSLDRKLMALLILPFIFLPHPRSLPRISNVSWPNHYYQLL